MKESLSWRRRMKLVIWERRRPLLLALFYALAAGLAALVLGLPLGLPVLGFPVWGWIVTSGAVLLAVVAIGFD